MKNSIYICCVITMKLLFKRLTAMVLSDIKNLKVNTKVKYNLHPREGVTCIEVYKTKPANYIISVESFNKIGQDAVILELTYQRKKLLSVIEN